MPFSLSFSKESSGFSTMALRIPNSADSARLNALTLMPTDLIILQTLARRPGSLFTKIESWVMILLSSIQITLVSTTLLALPSNLGSSPGALSSTLA